MDKPLEIIIKSKAMELGIPLDVAKAIVDDWFAYTREVMKSADPNNPETFKNIRWIKFGMIYSHEKKREAIDNKKFNRKKDEYKI